MGYGPLQFLFDGCPNGFPCIYFIFAFFYIALGITAFIQVRRRLRTQWWNMSNVFPFMNMILCKLRGLMLIIWSRIDAKPHDGGWIAVFDIPNLTFFSTYMLLCLIWSEFLWGPRPRRPKLVRIATPRFLFGAVHAFAYGLSPILWIMSAYESSQTLGRSLTAFLHFALNLIAGVVFCVMGWCLSSYINRTVSHKKWKKRKKRGLWAVIIYAGLSFLVTAFFQFVCGRITSGLDFTQNTILFIIIFVLELLAIWRALAGLNGIPWKVDVIVEPPPEPPKKSRKEKRAEKKAAKEAKKLEEANKMDKEGNEGEVGEIAMVEIRKKSGSIKKDKRREEEMDIEQGLPAIEVVQDLGSEVGSEKNGENGKKKKSKGGKKSKAKKKGGSKK